MTDQRPKDSRKWRFIIGLPVLIVLIVGILLLARPHTQPIATDGGLKVVAAENFWGNIAIQVGGSHVHVTSIITDPTADPHLYESSAADASAVASADIIVMNGLGYDDFMTKLLGTHKSTQKVIVASQVYGITDTTANPHLWYDIPGISRIANVFADSFMDKDPEHAADYQHNLLEFNTSLQPLLRTINQIKQKYQNVPVAYTEPVSGYLLSDAGLDIKTPPGFAKSIEDGNDPNPVDTYTMDKLIIDKQVKVLLYNSQATSPVVDHIKSLAQQSGISIIGNSETLPANQPTYQSWQQNQLDELLKALETK